MKIVIILGRYHILVLYGTLSRVLLLNVSLNVRVKGYLEKARNMFQEMDLQWNLDELDKIVASA
jgi:hypothetical protein